MHFVSCGADRLSYHPDLRLLIKQVLVLDEATSATDSMTDLAIQRTLTAMAQGRTVLVIAHRIETVLNRYGRP